MIKRSMVIGPACTYWLPSLNDLRRLRRHMNPQQPFSSHGCPQSEATHIECGVYLILMIQMWLAKQPLSAITPLSVQQYRFQSTNNIHLTQWITTPVQITPIIVLNDSPSTPSLDSTHLTNIDPSTITHL